MEDCMTINLYDVGDLVRVSGAFKDAAGTALDPTTVSFEFRDPAGAITRYVYPADSQLVRDAVGTYHVDVDANRAGTWRWRWEATGTGQAAEEGAFVVRESALT
jgi:hypothetical protein